MVLSARQRVDLILLKSHWRMVARGRYLKRVGRCEHIPSQDAFGNEVRQHIARLVAGVRTGMKNTTPAMNVQRTLRFETCRIMNGLGTAG